MPTVGERARRASRIPGSPPDTELREPSRSSKDQVSGRATQGRRARRRNRRSSAAYRRDALAVSGARRRSVAGRATGDDPGAHPLLGNRLRLAQVLSETECDPAVHDRDRRGLHQLHPREVAAREHDAADHDEAAIQPGLHYRYDSRSRWLRCASPRPAPLVAAGGPWVRRPATADRAGNRSTDRIGSSAAFSSRPAMRLLPGQSEPCRRPARPGRRWNQMRRLTI